MSAVLQTFAAPLKRGMPRELSETAEYITVARLIAEADDEQENDRLQIMLDWMWSEVLPPLQDIADERGFGDAWRAMTTQRTPEAARQAESESRAATRTSTWGEPAGVAAEAAEAAKRAEAAKTEAESAEWRAKSAYAAANAAWTVASAFGYLVTEARSERRHLGRPPVSNAEMWSLAWTAFDPIGVLQRLVNLARPSSGPPITRI